MDKLAVLIVDDEENVCKLLQKVLEKAGYTTFTALNGSDALDIIDINEIDIVITDIKMPKVSGIELLERIKVVDPSIDVIMITAFATLETAIEAMRIGARDYITKPFDIDEVLLSLKRISDSKACSKFPDNTVSFSTNNLETHIVSESKAMKNVTDIIKQVSDTKATVMLYGETGTGKELAAKMLHMCSSRRNNPLIKVNCAALPEALLESEMFGYEKGAFTGAVNSKPGRFELADGGTIFLDEIGDMPISLQVKLLRVIQEKEFERLGGTKTIKVDVRIVAATNKDLEEMVKNKTFREDLFYRLNVIPISLPPLKERKQDIKILIQHFLSKSSEISGRPPKTISNEAVDSLISYNWPGNVRELENIIERCVVITSGDIITINDIPDNIINYNKSNNITQDNGKLDNVLDSAEKDVITKTLKECNGNRTRASEILGISRRSLHRKLAKYNIE